MSVRKAVHRYFLPSHYNSYRPYILRKEWLFFFIAAIFSIEGVFVSSLFVEQSNVQAIAAAPSAGLVAAAAVNPSFFNSMGRELGRMAVDSKPFVPWALGAIAALITAAVLFAFFVHIEIQQTEMLFSGALVALFAYSLIITNFHILALL